ncbi:hypothetical protein BJ138DRAFT_1111918 [Hygrophoropsis aurantiaca]|uniref:Uncharacterized protein n=1 Tax=Hygrophoropsis aurantiaca TaxID=72124 RepID=A0ACB8AHB1_9AGAM|nr:hypothetical protein BJ138DRAFT_1111918 [Hygrophoropsis aurantiaca]
MPTLAATTASAASTAAAAPTVSDAILVYHIDIIIFGVILIFALLNVPRAYARFSRGSEWLQGHMLRSVPIETMRPTSISVGAAFMDLQKEAQDVDESTDSLTAYNSMPELPKHSTVISPGAPRHMPMVSSIFHPIASILCHRVHDGYSVAQVLLMLAYIGITFYGAFYKCDIWTDPKRAGYVISSQIPFVYAFATKNNLIGLLVGVGYEKLNYLHRLVGRLMVIGANVHTIGYIYKWALAGQMQEKLALPYVRWGFVALVCFDMLGFLSMAFVRSKSYNLFFSTHAISLIIFLPAACYHRPACVPYVIAACVFYGVDHLCRAIKTRFATAKLRPLPELGITRVEVPEINAGWRAGQHVRIRVLSSGMGWWGWSEVHPFTIASVARTPEGMVLMCKKSGRWTNSLYNMAQTAVYGESGKEVGRDVRLMVEGPYGGVGHTVVSSYSGALFVVGGSGVTFALSAVQDLIRSGNDCEAKVIEIVWSVPDPSSLTPVIPLLASMIEESTHAKLRISVFYTRAISVSFEGMYLPPGITLAPGRPRIGKLLDGVITDTMSSKIGGESRNGVFVGVCGPVALANNVATVVKDFDVNLRKAVGGVELHEEVFGW